MNPTLDAFLRSWPFEPWILASLIASGAIYLRGWFGLRRRDPRRWNVEKPMAFLGGLAAVFFALASPIEPFAVLFLQIHMVQHVLLMMVVPPLIWLSEPFFPMLYGLPRPIRVYWIAPFLRSRFVRRFFTSLSHPRIALPLFIAATWGWHVPAAYELALRSAGWHYLQHACFVATGLLFWYPVIRPYPARPAWSSWLLLPYLLVADVQNTVLAALLTFSDRLLYPYYAQVPRIGGLSALEDQSAAGLIMWIPGSLAYLVPLFVIGVRLLLSGTESRTRRTALSTHSIARKGAPAQTLSLPILGQPRRVQTATFDLLQIPYLGRFLRWRHARPAMQVPLLMLAGVIVYDGLRGPSIAATNLAGILPWIHWRGLLIFGLLIAGNVFCMACPFTLPRQIARRWLPAGRDWPHWLRNKWLAVILLVGFLWAYEVCSLWNSPWWTAWIVLAYFAAAFAIDGFFRSGSFCKYVCPIGQFNFVQSLISPLEVKVRDPLVCASCHTKDCIRGRGEIPGCGSRLFQLRKSSNMDCTFCLDCIHACPHENVGILAVEPAATLYRDPYRSGIGRFSRRADLAALVVVLVFGAFINAAGMTGPVVAWQNRLAAVTGLRDALPMTAVCYLAALVVIPFLTVRATAAVSRKWAGLNQSWREVAASYVWAMVPLGFSMWLTHYSFHFLTSFATLVPVTQRFAADLGWTLLGPPQWSCACCVPPATWLLRLEIVFLDCGFLLSLYAAYRIATARAERLEAALKSFAPWGTLVLLLFMAGLWIVFQPMQMRGTMPPMR